MKFFAGYTWWSPRCSCYENRKGIKSFIEFYDMSMVSNEDAPEAKKFCPGVTPTFISLKIEAKFQEVFIIAFL